MKVNGVQKQQGYFDTY